MNSQIPKNPQKSVQRNPRTKICIIKNCENSKGTRLPIRMYR